MDNKTMDSLVSELLKLEIEKRNAEKKMASVKNSIKALMDAEGLDVVETEKHIVKYTKFVTNRFDTTKFKGEHADLYESYLYESPSERLTYK